MTISQTKRLALGLSLLFAAMAAVSAANAQQPIAPLMDCDRLAANPTDARRFSGLTGVQFKELRENLDAALSACQTAVAAYPKELRFRYQYARALQIKDKNAAFSIFRQLVAANYPAAYDNVGWLLISQNNDYPNAIKMFQDGYALGDADCAVSLFEMIERDKWHPPEANRIRLQLLEKATAANHAGAINALPLEKAKQAQFASTTAGNQPSNVGSATNGTQAELERTRLELEQARRELEALRRQSASPGTPPNSPAPNSAVPGNVRPKSPRELIIASGLTREDDLAIELTFDTNKNLQRGVFLAFPDRSTIARCSAYAGLMLEIERRGTSTSSIEQKFTYATILRWSLKAAEHYSYTVDELDPLQVQYVHSFLVSGRWTEAAISAAREWVNLVGSVYIRSKTP